VSSPRGQGDGGGDGGRRGLRRRLPAGERQPKGERQRGAELVLDVGPVAHGGHCVARHEGRVVFVRHALPGERVRAVVTEGGSDDPYWRADAVDVLVASPERVRAPCPYARPGGCGGCDWQHATPAEQRRLKAAVVTEQLAQLAGVELVDLQVEAVPGDERGLGWRTRVQFAVDPEGRVGLHRHRSEAVVAVDTCLIAHPAVTSVHVERHRWGHLAGVEVIASGTGERMVVLTESDERPGDAARLRIPRLDRDVSVVVAAGSDLSKLRGRRRLTEEAAGRLWRVSGSGFWQVHPAAADTLVDEVLEILAPRDGEVAVDLYAGVGLFAGVLAELVGPRGEVIAIESDRQAVADARRNLHGLDHVRVVEGRVERVLRSTRGLAADLVVLDPPRSGAGRTACQALAALRPRAVAYVSCDPAALGRDVALLAAQGYRLQSVRAFDLFPMTHHVECVALLVPEAS
jgi:tRNA/tmRNA/rRNA uracil-C5-methylase (TrmA/RlmC/RlmD family)